MAANRVVYLWFAADDAAVAVRLRDVLAASDVELRPVAERGSGGTPSDQLVVLVSRSALSARAELDAVVDAWDGILLPVSVDGVLPRDVGREDGIASLSWMIGEDEAAERIAVIADTSPAWLLAWDRLEAATRRFTVDATSLLSARALAEADQVVMDRSRALLPALDPELRRLLDRSRRRARDRRRIAAAVTLATMVVLLVALAVALVQRGQAEQARHGAERATRASQADRLSRMSRAYAGTDPDVPTILARRAYAIDPSREARDSLRIALDAGPKHTSVQLQEAPTSMAATRNGRLVAVGLVDGNVVVYRTKGGVIAAQIPRREARAGVPALAVSPDDRRLALAYNDGVIVVASLEDPGTVVARIRARRRAAVSSRIAWLPGGRLLTAWEGKRITVTRVAGAKTRSLTVAGIAAPSTLAVSAGGTRAAVLGDDAVVVLSTRTLRACGEVRVPASGVEVEIASDGGGLFVTHSGKEATELPMPPRCRAGARRVAKMRWPEATSATAVTALPDRAVGFGTHAGELVIQEPGAGYPAMRFAAHVGRVADVVTAGPGRLVTAGMDHWLRVWETGRVLVGYPAGRPAVLLLESYVADESRQAQRPMIALDPRGTTVTVGGFATGLLGRARLDDLDRVLDWHYIAGGASIHPVGASCGALAAPMQYRAFLQRCDGKRARVVWRQGPGLTTYLRNLAISGDAQHVAVADGWFAQLTHVASGKSMAMAFDGAGTMTFLRGGVLLLIHPSGKVATMTIAGGIARRARLRLGSDSVRAAGVVDDGRTGLVVTTSGAVQLMSLTNGRRLARLPDLDGLHSVIAVRCSPDGRLAVVIARDGLVVYDLRARRVVLERAVDGLGERPRDAVFTPTSDQLLMLRADQGVEAIGLAAWRFDDGVKLLRATRTAVPRALRRGELDDLLDGAP